MTTGGVGINLVGGSSNIAITGNSFTNFGNALVLIANSSGFPSTPQAHDILFSDNTITQSTSTALYIGGNNMIDVTITNNSITDSVGSTSSAIQITPGYSGDPDAWLEANNRPLQGFIIQGNFFNNVAYGLTVRDGVQLETPTSVQIIENRFCIVTVAAIENTDDTSVLALDNDFCDAEVLGNVDVQNTPELAATGADTVVTLGLAGGGVLVLGALLLFVARQRLGFRHSRAHR